LTKNKRKIRKRKKKKLDHFFYMVVYTTQIMMLSFMQAISNFTGAKLDYEYSVKNPSGVSTTSSASIVPETTENPININLNTLLGSILDNSLSTRTDNQPSDVQPSDVQPTDIQTQLTTLQANYNALEARMLALEAKMQSLSQPDSAT